MKVNNGRGMREGEKQEMAGTGREKEKKIRNRKEELEGGKKQ